MVTPFRQDGELDEESLQNLNRFLEYDPAYVAPCKEALEMVGLAAGTEGSLYSR